MAATDNLDWQSLKSWKGIRRVLFTLVVLAYLVFFLVIMEGWRFLADALTAWFENGLGLHDEFEPAHRVHFLLAGAIFWPAVLGMLAQLRSPQRNIAGQLMALVPFVAIAIAVALTGVTEVLPIVLIFGSFVAVATVLHPAGLDLVRSLKPANVDRVLLVLLVIAAIPLLAFASTQIGLQTGAIDHPDHDHAAGAAHEEVHEEHVEFGHFMLVTSFIFTVIGIGLVASLSQAGWWLPAWLTGLLAVHFGLASALFVDTSSSAGLLWGLLAIIWGVVFIAAAELTQNVDRPTLLGKRGITSSA